LRFLFLIFVKVLLSGITASVATAVIKNHAFADGNKRAAFLSIGLFLFLNEWKLSASPIDAIRAIMSTASGDMNEEDLARWIEEKRNPI